jgi:uncharacterized membrane protein
MIRCYHCGWTYQENELQTINYEGQVLRICPACLKELKLSEYKKRWVITKSKKDIRWGWMGLFIVILVIIPVYNIGIIIINLDTALKYNYFNLVPDLYEMWILQLLIYVGLMIFSIYAGLSLYFFKKKAIYTTREYLYAYIGAAIFTSLFLDLPLALYTNIVNPVDIPTRIIVTCIVFGFFYWFIHYSQTVKRIYLGNSEQKITEQKLQNEALNILGIRYAKGEITKEQYEQMKKDLE